MQFTFLILLLPELYFSIAKSGALAPDIYLEGKLLSNSDSTVLQLICSTNTAVQLCSVEFLIEERTHDNIRYHDNKCYHSMWICSPSLCTCSDNCSSFTLNVTVTNVMMNRLYSCETRIEKDGVTYMASISVMPDDNGGLILYKKIVVPFGSVTVSQKATTSSPNISTVSAPLIIAGIASGFLSCVLLVIVLIVIRQRRWCYSIKAHQDRSIEPSNGHSPNLRRTQAHQDSSIEPSNGHSPNLRRTQARQDIRNEPSNSQFSKSWLTHALQKSRSAPSLFQTLEYRHMQDINTTMNYSNVPAYYSVLPRSRSSTSTHSSASGEGLCIYKIHVENKILSHRQAVTESYA